MKPLPEGLGNLHKNKSGYPRNRLLNGPGDPADPLV